MTTVARHRHPKPSFFTLIPNPRQGCRATPNRRVAFIAKATILPLGDYEYTLHTTKGWRRKRLHVEADPVEIEVDETGDEI